MNMVFSTRDRQGRSKRTFPMKIEHPRGRALPDTLAGTQTHEWTRQTHELTGRGRGPKKS